MVLDASAVLAFLQSEPGADRVAEVIESAIISAVNWAETVSKLALGGMPAEIATSTVNALEVHPFMHEHAVLAAEMAPAAKPHGLSLGDRACIALGQFTGWPVLTTDRKWQSLDIGVRIEVVR